MSFAVIGLISHLSRGLEESIYAEKEFPGAAACCNRPARSREHPDIEWGDPLLHSG
jgi:hypothetical protein